MPEIEMQIVQTGAASAAASAARPSMSLSGPGDQQLGAELQQLARTGKDIRSGAQYVTHVAQATGHSRLR